MRLLQIALALMALTAVRGDLLGRGARNNRQSIFSDRMNTNTNTQTQQQTTPPEPPSQAAEVDTSDAVSAPPGAPPTDAGEMPPPSPPDTDTTPITPLGGQGEGEVGAAGFGYPTVYTGPGADMYAEKTDKYATPPTPPKDAKYNAGPYTGYNKASDSTDKGVFVPPKPTHTERTPPFIDGDKTDIDTGVTGDKGGVDMGGVDKNGWKSDTVVPVYPPDKGRLTPQLARTIAAQQVCVSTPEEYVAAFTARDNRCVSNDLLFTVQGAPTVNEAVVRLNGKVGTRAMLFWSDRQNGEKYMRIGFPKSIGTFVESVAPGFEQSYASAYFTGSDDVSNGQALMEDIGFPAEYSRIDSVYALAVMTRPPISVTPLVYPTWPAVRDMWVWKIINDIKFDASYYLNDKIIEILTQNTFPTLTACPTLCTYADTHFPSNLTATAPIQQGTRTSLTQCTCKNLAYDKTRPDASCSDRYYLTAPNSYDSSSEFCDPLWLSMKKNFADITSTCSLTTLQAAERELLYQLANVDKDVNISQKEKDRQSAIIFRAFTFTTCMGNMNELFSGNGQTYTALGGLKSSTGNEVISSSFDLSSTDVQYIFLCLNGSGRPVNGTCV